MNCPRLISGYHYQTRGKWRVALMMRVGAILSHDFRGEYSFRHGEIELMHLAGRALTFTEYFACDGFSPVVKLLGVWIPLTPTPVCGMFPAVGHDGLTQFASVPGCPWDQKFANDEFYNSLVAGGCSTAASLYHGAVSGRVGRIYKRLRHRPDPLLNIVRLS